jgi:hypothetical protein
VNEEESACAEVVIGGALAAAIHGSQLRFEEAIEH